MKTDFHVRLNPQDRFPKLLVSLDWTWPTFPLPGENINVKQTQYVVIARAFELLVTGEMFCGVLVQKAEETLISARSSIQMPQEGSILFGEKLS